MKKSKIKRVVSDCMLEYYKNGYTNTGNRIKENIFSRIDKLYNNKHKTNQSLMKYSRKEKRDLKINNPK